MRPHKTISIVHNIQEAEKHPAQPHALDPTIFFEKPERLIGFLDVAQGFVSDRVVISPCSTPVSESALHLVHPPEFIEKFRNACASAGERVEEFGTEYFVSRGSFLAACSAVACALQCIREVLSATASHAISLCRPPGHHSEPTLCMGFCGFSTAAIAALYAQKYGAQRNRKERVCVVDYDVHSGNGTIKALRGKPDVLFTEIRTMTTDAIHTPVPCRAYPYPPCTAVESSHWYDYAPSGENSIVEDMYLGTTGDEYLARFREKIQPHIDRFAPTLLILSAGFDGMLGDPLGDLGLEQRHIRQLVYDLTRSGIPSVTILEGGYDLEHNRSGFAGHIEGLLGK